jgi:hypothetical protein
MAPPHSVASLGPVGATSSSVASIARLLLLLHFKGDPRHVESFQIDLKPRRIALKPRLVLESIPSRATFGCAATR